MQDIKRTKLSSIEFAWNAYGFILSFGIALPTRWKVDLVLPSK